MNVSRLSSEVQQSSSSPPLCEGNLSCEILMWHDLGIHENITHWNVTWVICMCDLKHSFVWYESFIHWTLDSRPQPLCACNMSCNNFLWHDFLILVTWLSHACAVTLSCVWRDSFMRVTWLVYTSNATHLQMWHASYVYCNPFVCVQRFNESFICVPWLIHMCAMARSYKWHDAFICILILSYRSYDSSLSHVPDEE